MNNIHINTLRAQSHDKVFLTMDFKQSWTLAEIQGILEEALAYVRQNGLFIVYEKTYGSMEYMDFYLDLRARLFRERGMPAPPNTYFEGLSITRTCLISATFCAVLPKDATVRASYCHDVRNGVAGSLVNYGTDAYLYLSSIEIKRLRHDDLGALAVWPKMDDSLLSNGFTFNDIIRSSIRINDIHKIEAQRESLPADDSSANYKIDVDFQCMKAADSRAEVGHFQLQYKQTSSVGMLTKDGDCLEFRLSGKTNYKFTGDELPPENVYTQIRNTLVNVRLLLAQAGMGYADILRATCFFKRKDYYVLFKKAADELELGDFCQSFVVADAHREDLLFELDATAAIANKE